MLRSVGGAIDVIYLKAWGPKSGRRPLSPNLACAIALGCKKVQIMALHVSAKNRRGCGSVCALS